MHSDPEVDFTCSYSSQIDGVSTDFAVKSETQVKHKNNDSFFFRKIKYISYFLFLLNILKILLSKLMDQKDQELLSLNSSLLHQTTLVILQFKKTMSLLSEK